MRSLRHLVTLAAAALSALSLVPAAQAQAQGGEAVKAAEGLWAYTALEARGTSMPLTGVILFKDGQFLQQSIFDGEPFDAQGAMAHAGPFGPGPRGIHMVGQQTISTSPGKTPAYSFRTDTQHDISVDRQGEAMTIVFGSGTIQKFRRIGPAKGDLYKLANGSLALVDGYFVLVSGDEKGAVTGYGKVRKRGTAYSLDAIRWAEATPDRAISRKDITIKATFDGKRLVLADGRAFAVTGKAGTAR